MVLTRINSRPRSALRSFLRNEAIGGMLLMIAAALAMAIANSPLATNYFQLLHLQTGPVLTPKLGSMTIHLWINDALMALFFMLVGLEIKREFVDGRLSSPEDRRLPFIAAFAGMALPALFYILFIGGDPALFRGWAIPAATDIAFAIAILALLGSRAPASLKLFLTTVAIVDDIGAVAIIALFYTSELNIMALAGGAIIWAAMFALGRIAKVNSIWPYMLLAGLLWYCILLSGVHATIAGVLAAFAIPLRKTPGAPDAEDSLLHRMEHKLAPLVSFLIVPLFGFANAGVSLSGGAKVTDTLPFAIIAGLFLGKQFGIFSSVYCAVKLGLAAKPAHASWMQIYGVALLCGIGFTMSLFIGGLAFGGGTQMDEVKIGVLAGSLLSAMAGWLVLRSAAPKNILK
jgi:Na+:H+ antiporter, NhaA family